MPNLPGKQVLELARPFRSHFRILPRRERVAADNRFVEADYRRLQTSDVSLAAELHEMHHGNGLQGNCEPSWACQPDRRDAEAGCQSSSCPSAV
jgi:hypothetical protein